MPHDFSRIPSVVFAVGRNSPGVRLLGTAFNLPAGGLFATASHVTGTDESNLVIVMKPAVTDLADYQDTSDTRVSVIPVRIHAADPFHDLVVLQALGVTGHSNIRLSSADAAPVGSPVAIFGFPHADHGRMIVTRQDATVGARVLIEAGKIKAKHVVLNTQARPGQSGSPIFLRETGELVAVLIGSYAPGGGGGISLGGIDPHTLHQTTHAVSAEYLQKML
jgi:hypothetical protein